MSEIESYRWATINEMGFAPAEEVPEPRETRDRQFLRRLEEFLRYEQTVIAEDELADPVTLERYVCDLQQQIADAWEAIEAHLRGEREIEFHAANGPYDPTED
jgi:hypothetical protein